ncbi:MAG TPA: response regulator, partial [Herpetosiphonaceae bacterium]
MRPPRILVVEDHPDIAVLIQVLLQRVGCEVISAGNGQDALALYAERRPDAVVLDLNLPRLPGWEVCKAIKSQSTTPIVVVTGQTPTEGAAQRLAIGADVYLLKPFKVLTLLAELERLLKLRVARSARPAPSQAARSVPAAPA